MTAAERYFYGEYGASRAYLLSKALLIILALDIWQLMIGHAGRYGIDGFNVAHFAWLDAVQPLPTAGWYVGVLLLTGLLALVLGFTELRRGPALLLFALYTFSWSMSMLDSYQHHYFVSLILLCVAFFPRVQAHDIHPAAAPPTIRPQGRDELYGWLYIASLTGIAVAYAAIDSQHPWLAFGCFAAAVSLATWFYSPGRLQPPARTTGFGYPLLGASIAIVYCFTAFAKVDANWIEGHTMLRISAAEKVFAPLADLGVRLGMPRDQVWSWLSTAVIPQEFALAVAYLIASTQDRARSRWPRLLSMLGFGLAIVLHVGAEVMRLKIGWFSYYMLLLGSCYLLPLAVVDRLATLFTWPERQLQRIAARFTATLPAANVVTPALIAGACGWLALVATRIDLPGAPAACLLAGLALVALFIAQNVRGRDHSAGPAALATAFAAACMWLSIAQSPVRWDFYRYLGGDLKRRGELAAALAAYERGDRYAPPGANRTKVIRELRRSLERRKKQAADPRAAETPAAEPSEQAEAD